MGSTQLPPHGQYALSVDGPMLILRARGPWNREAVQLYRDELALLSTPLEQGAWGLLAIVQGEALLLPDAAALLQQKTATDLARGRVATALVFDNVILQELVEEQFSAIYAGLPQSLRFFDDLHEARAWLQSEIARAQLETFDAIA